MSKDTVQASQMRKSCTLIDRLIGWSLPLETQQPLHAQLPLVMLLAPWSSVRLTKLAWGLMACWMQGCLVQPCMRACIPKVKQLHASLVRLILPHLPALSALALPSQYGQPSLSQPTPSARALLLSPMCKTCRMLTLKARMLVGHVANCTIP